MKYTVEQVSVLMDVTRETVREWLIHGKLKGVKSGRIWVINKEDIKDQNISNVSHRAQKESIRISLDIDSVS
jgi:excisionase family DNA binding protein